jgi:hypothetical protein
MFASPGVAASFVELTRGRNVSLVKRRLNQFLDQTNLDESTDRYQLLFDRLDDAVGPPDIDEVGYVAFDRLRNLLRMSPAAAQRWARWAIASDLILRGVEASCKRCGHKQWRPLAEVIPSLICHGCGHKIDNPHGFNHIEYRYRASESLLRAMSHDVLPCLLAIRYISSTLGGKDGMVFGAYPGIELRQPGSTRVEAELDVLVVLRNGGLVVGECKTNARGLTPEELTKLWTAADQLDARATFAATLDRGSNCQSEWRHQTAPNGRPHFALTAEHLFDLNTRGPTADTDLFDWRDDYSLGPEADVDKAFNDYIERTGNDNEQLLRAPWMTKDD